MAIVGFSCALHCILFILLEFSAQKSFASIEPRNNATDKKTFATQLEKIFQKLSEINNKLSAHEERLKLLSRSVKNSRCNEEGRPSKEKVLRDCADVFRSGQHSDGIYTIQPDGLGPIEVFCDMRTDGGGWTLIQKRFDGTVNFYRGWNEYKNGFGTAGGEHWLGLENIYRITNQGRYTLRVELRGNFIQSAHALYSHFAVGNESTNYTLVLGTYSGTAGDSLGWHRGMAFTTKDRDNDKSVEGNCARFYKGAWWYKTCLFSNLNGVYYKGDHSSYADGINWKTWGGFFYSASRVSMKIRPINFRKKQSG